MDVINNVINIPTINTTYNNNMIVNSDILGDCYFSNNTTDSIIYNNGLIFNGTNYLQFNKTNIINSYNEDPLFIEMDFTLNTNITNNNGLLPLFTFYNNNNGQLVDSLLISLSYNYISYISYSEVNTIFRSNHFSIKLNLNKKYNLKIIKTNRDQLSIFIDNILYYRTDSFNVLNTASTQYNKVNIYQDLFLGSNTEMFNVQNFVGIIHNFKILRLNYKNYIGESFETNVDNLLYHFKLDFFTRFNITYADDYKYVPIVNLGHNPDNAIIKTPPLSANSFKNLGGNETFWYSPKAGSANRFFINKNPFKLYNECSITFRLKTNTTLAEGTYFDCRSALTKFDGFQICSTAANNSAITINISLGNSTTAWDITLQTPSNTLAVNTEYFIAIVKSGNIIKLYINNIEIITHTLTGPIKYVNTDLHFFNTITGTIVSTHCIKDLKIYKNSFKDLDTIDTNKIITPQFNDISSKIEHNEKYIKYVNINHKNFGMYKYTEIAPDNTIYKNMINESIYKKEIYIYAEGHPEYNVDLYRNNKLLKRNINNQYVMIDYDFISQYKYKVIETNEFFNLVEHTLGKLYINLSVIKCEDSNFIARLYNTETGKFIGEYTLINKSVTINNLYTTEFYDVMLIDKNKKYENMVKSKLKPISY